MRTNSLSLLLLFGFLGLSSLMVQAQTLPPRSGALVDTLMALPIGGKIQTRWVLPPNQELAESVRLESPSRGGPELTFSVDVSGNPWIGIDGKRLLCPATSFRAILSEPWQKFVHLDQGAMLFSTVRHLGFMGIDTQVKTDKDGWPIVPFQPITQLPGYYSRLYKGTSDCVYLVNGNTTTGKSTLYLLKPESSSTSYSTTPATVSRYQKLLETEEPMTAVAGDGKTTFIAFGKLVACLDQDHGSLSPWTSQPAEEVCELAWQPQVGLFYASTKSVGYLGAQRVIRFVETPNPKICLVNGVLNVFFPKNYGVLAFENIGDLRESDLP